ncbi:MAG TPA: hypothetical protein VGG28_31230 [Kofleriaceae bacterium]|jgi:hypothetical protein
MSETRAFREATIRRATEGPATSSSDERRAAFAHRTAELAEPARALLANVVAKPTAITDADVREAAAALGDDRVFELVVCAALGEATRQLDAAVAALDEAGLK